VFEERPDIDAPMPADLASKFWLQMSSANGAASTGVFPDYPAPVVRNAGTKRELVMMRWGMPPPQHARACHQYLQHLVSALAGLAQTGEPVPGPSQQLRRIRAGAEPGDQEEGRSSGLRSTRTDRYLRLVGSGPSSRVIVVPSPSRSPDRILSTAS